MREIRKKEIGEKQRNERISIIIASEGLREGKVRERDRKRDLLQFETKKIERREREKKKE